MEKQPDQMIVLDFSGTLSLAAARFGREELLLQKLKESGLWELGVDSTWRFWTEIVNPTWEQGSTTPIGYRRLICDRLRQLSAERGAPPEEERFQACATAFVANYFNCSVLASEWQPLLRWLVARPETLAVIATDHYAEATVHILSQVQALGIEAVPALQPRRPGHLLVANSADLGYPKASRQFWEALKQAQGVERLSIIGIVDDFGFNEQAQDAYATPARVARRQEQTVSLLADVFSAQVRVFPFFLKDKAMEAAAPGCSEWTAGYSELVDRATCFVQQLLSEGHEDFPCTGGGGL